MSIWTDFFHLIKPAKNDGVKVQDFNNNMDIIDEEMHKPPLTVNGLYPDPVTRDIAVEEVPLADNLTSDVAQMVQETFIERMSGGTASIDDGTAFLSAVNGNQIHTGQVDEVINLYVYPAPRTAPPDITATLDAAVFEAYVQTAGTYTLTYTTAWSENPVAYGVTVSNTPIEGDEIVIEWDGTSDPELTVNPAPRTAPPAITATIDRDTFVAYVQTSGTTTLTYTNAWSADPALYGVTVTNTPIAGDVISIEYTKADRGTITTANPIMFNSTGWNLYDGTTRRAKVLHYSDAYGYLIGGNYTIVEFSPTISGERSSVEVVNGLFNVSENGYIFVTGGDETTYILATWSDWVEGYEGDFAEYSDATIDLSGAMAGFPYGLCAIGAVHDEINLNALRTVKRIGRLEYTAGNLETVQEMGVPYDCDTNYIYYVLPTPTTTSISGIEGSYAVSDHGIEYFTGTTVPVGTEILYGENLKDKLRTDLPNAINANTAAINANTAAINGNTQNIQKLKADIGIVEDGDTATNAIAEGKGVVWKGVLCTADADIAQGDTLATDGLDKNLTVMAGGLSNALNNNMKWTCLLESRTISNEASVTLSDSIENYNEIYVQMHVYVSSGTYRRGCSTVIPVDAIKAYGYGTKNQFIISAIGSVMAESSKLNYAEYAQISFANATTFTVNFREARGWSGSYYFTIYAR